MYPQTVFSEVFLVKVKLSWALLVEFIAEVAEFFSKDWSSTVEYS